MANKKIIQKKIIQWAVDHVGIPKCPACNEDAIVENEEKPFESVGKFRIVCKKCGRHTDEKQYDAFVISIPYYINLAKEAVWEFSYRGYTP